MEPERQFLRFAFVGAIGTVLHYTLLIIFVSGFSLDPAIGAMAGATCGAAFNYWANYRFTFDSVRPHNEALPRFIFVAGIGVLLNGVIVKVLTLLFVDYLISQVVATSSILVINFIVSKLWIFKLSR